MNSSQLQRTMKVRAANSKLRMQVPRSPVPSNKERLMMRTTTRWLLALATAALPIVAQAQGHVRPVRFEVTVTNLTRAQQFTPILLVTHRPALTLFTLGKPASDELRILAEEGNTGPLVALLTGNPNVTQVQSGAGLTNPGATQTFVIEARPFVDRLSVAAMLIPTNDTFFSLNAFDLPEFGFEARQLALAYDAGTEVNDELCSSIPGPFFEECKGSGGGGRVGGGEGYVYIGNGMHGVGDMNEARRDWNNPVAFIRIRMIR